MVIIDTYVAVTLLAFVAVAALAGIALLGVVAGRALALRHSAGNASPASVRSYDGHLAIGH